MQYMQWVRSIIHKIMPVALYTKSTICGTKHQFYEVDVLDDAHKNIAPLSTVGSTNSVIRARGRAMGIIL